MSKTKSDSIDNIYTRSKGVFTLGVRDFSVKYLINMMLVL